jgi:hypothetical protein
VMGYNPAQPRNREGEWAITAASIRKLQADISKLEDKQARRSLSARLSGRSAPNSSVASRENEKLLRLYDELAKAQQRMRAQKAGA